MRTEYDFSPLFRSTVGFDRMFSLLEQSAHSGIEDRYPAYDIDRTGDDEYRITLAVAGFRPEDLNLMAQQNLLIISGKRRNAREDSEVDARRRALYRGIANHAFERRFELADHVKVVGANLTDGLLVIDLKREVPEEMRPRRIEIGGSVGDTFLGPRQPKQVEGQAQAA